MKKNVIKIWGIALITILDGIRRNALIGLIILSLSIECGGLLFADFIPRDIGRASSDFILSVGWLTGFLFLMFHAVQIMAWDEKKRTIQVILARPVSRSQYVLGMFVGLAVLLIFLNLILASIGYGILIFLKGSLPDQYFKDISLLAYSLSWLGLLCIESMLLSAIIFFSSIVRGGFLVLLLSIAYNFICSGLPVVRDGLKFSDSYTTGTLSVSLKVMTAIFPDFSKFDFKKIIFVSSGELLSQIIVIDLLLAIFYIVVVLWSSTIIYQRRDLQ